MEQGGIQLSDAPMRFAGIQQMIDHIKSSDVLYNDPKIVIMQNSFVADPRYGAMCVRYSRVYGVKEAATSNEVTSTVRDEGYYFQHPRNSRVMYKIHLEKRSADASADTAYTKYMEQFYTGLSINGIFVPTWTIGINTFSGFGQGDGLDFGYIDSETGNTITIDPGASMGMSLYGYRRIKKIWIAGAEFGISSAPSLSYFYSNLAGYTDRGTVAELNGGVLLFSQYRHRFMITGGPTFYSNPILRLEIVDSLSRDNISFKYKPAVGVSLNVMYAFVLRKRWGQLLAGFKYHQVRLELARFTVNEVEFQTDALNQEYASFKRPNAANIAVVFAYQYTFR